MSDGWAEVDCGCCAGLEWGGESPRECRDCGGRGFLCVHKHTGRIADYPGGPFRGRLSEKEKAKAVEALEEAEGDHD